MSKYVKKYHIKYDSINESRQLEVKSTDIQCLDGVNDRWSTRIVGLKPWEVYRLQVCAENSAGRGEWSKPVEVVMNKSAPPKPTAVSMEFTENTDAKSKELKLKIDQPIHCEEVEEYRVTYLKGMGEEPVIHQEEVQQGYNAAFVLTFPEGGFSGLRFGVKNKYGWSFQSDTVHASNLKPSKVQTFAYIIDTVTQDSVELAWEEPSTNSAVVDRYELEWWTSKKKKNTKEMFCTVCNLHPETEYHFRVSPITKFGNRGEPSEELVIKTKPVTA